MGITPSLMQRLDGASRRRLRQILVGLLSQKQFDMMLDEYLNRDRQTISLAENKGEIIFDVIREANIGLWIGELVEAARKLRPNDPELNEFANTQLELGITGSRTAFERLVVPGHAFLDFANWNARASAIERRVCRIHYPLPGGTCYGTGFLVGPSEVLTNYHVVEPILKGKATPASVSAQFDYKVVGTKTLDGTTLKLANDWLVDSSEYSPGDEEKTPATDPTTEQLDYALLRLATAAGEDPIGPTSDESAETRGWIPLTSGAGADPQVDSPVLIVQHPKGAPLSLAMEMNGVLSINANGTRVRYRTNTEGGSSGSPVFDMNWQLIALHHVGDPDFSKFHKPEYNQGIPIRHVAALLQKRGKLPAGA